MSSRARLPQTGPDGSIVPFATSTDYREYVPHPALQRFVDRFWVASAEASVAPRPILPDGCIDVILDLTRAGSLSVVGTMTLAIVYQPRARVRLAAVRFKPGGAVPFLRVPGHELTDRRVTAEEIGARWLEGIGQHEPGHPRHAVLALERCLLDRLPAIGAPDRLVAHAAGRLLGPKPPSILELSRETGWTRQYLGRSFQNQVGLSPKQLARVARLQRACAALFRHPSAELAELALRLGYFDQAHMARDFRELAGMSPTVARTLKGSIFPIQSLFTDR